MHRWLAWGATQHVLERDQWVDRPVVDVFPFFDDPNNLARITPRWLRFEVTRMSTATIRAGTVITYRLRWFGIPYSWKTVIESWEPERQFVDRMLNGPYVEWHHTHAFEEREGGTRICDRVRYRVPFGPFGSLLHALLIRRQLESIFDFRAARVAEILDGGVLRREPPS